MLQNKFFADPPTQDVYLKIFFHTHTHTHTCLLFMRCCCAVASHFWPLFPSSGYELFAFISHMGESTMSGHYVCHIKKEGRWAADLSGCDAIFHSSRSYLLPAHRLADKWTCLLCRWVIYNDHKVCLSERPPKDLGYIYFYHRLSSS